jgi:hypothetical protein
MSHDQQQRMTVGSKIDPRFADGAEWTANEVDQVRQQGGTPPGRYVVSDGHQQQHQPPQQNRHRPPAVGPVFGEAHAESDDAGNFVRDQPDGNAYSQLAGIAQGEKAPRNGRWFTFTRDVLETMDEPLRREWTRFFVISLKPIEEERVHDMDLSQAKTAMEMVKTAVYGLGNRRCGYDEREAWWVAIGPVGRNGVLKCYQHLNMMTESQGEQLLATAEPGTL